MDLVGGRKRSKLAAVWRAAVREMRILLPVGRSAASGFGVTVLADGELKFLEPGPLAKMAVCDGQHL